MQVDPAQIEKTMVLIGPDPLLYYAGVMTLLWLGTLAALTVSLQLRVTQAVGHKDEIKGMLIDERERAARQVGVAAGFLEFIRRGALVVRAGNPKKLRPAEDLDALAPDAPTVSTLKPGGPADGTDDDRGTPNRGGGET